MEYRSLGRTGVMVSPLCLGAMNSGGPTNEEDSIAMINRALDGGINILSTGIDDAFLTSPPTPSPKRRGEQRKDWKSAGYAAAEYIIDTSVTFLSSVGVSHKTWHHVPTAWGNGMILSYSSASFTPSPICPYNR